MNIWSKARVRAFKRTRTFSRFLERALLPALLIAVFVLQSTGQARAGTTGIINGRINDASTKATLAGVIVEAVSPSGTYHSTTDAGGHFVMTGVVPDTYTVSFSFTGYQPVAVSGVSVFADQTAIVNEPLQKSLRTIAKVSTRSVTGAFQPGQTTDTYTVGTTGINQLLGTTLNYNEGSLLTSLPGVSVDSSGDPSIRGGRINELGYEFEGVPFVDPVNHIYSNSRQLPGFALSSVQLTAGEGDVSVGNTGTGVFNLLAKRGTYPTYGTVEAGIGGPLHFEHDINFEYGTASPNGRWSEYASFAAQNLAPQYGGSNPLPSAELQTFQAVSLQNQREFVNNLVYKFGKNNSQALQLFTDFSTFNEYFGYGGHPFCFKTCDPLFLSLVQSISGIAGAPLTQTQVGNLVTFDAFQTSPNELVYKSGLAPAQRVATNQAVKLEFDDNIDPSTYFAARLYRTIPTTAQEVPVGNGGDGIFSQHFFVGGYINGISGELTKQLSARHLLKLGGSFEYQHPELSFNSGSAGLLSTLIGGGDPLIGFGAFEFADFLSPNDPNCPLAPLGGTCGYLAKYFPKGIPRLPAFYGEITSSDQQLYGAYLSDTWTPNDRFKLDAGVRLDTDHYLFPTPGIDPATCTFLFLPKSYTPPAATAPAGTCGTADFSNIGNDQLRPKIVQPRLSVSYRFGSNDSLLASYGRSVFFTPPIQADGQLGQPGTYYSAYNRIPSYDALGSAFAPSFGLPAPIPAQCGLRGFDVPCRNYGEQLYWEAVTLIGVPYQPVKPETFDNYQVSYSHQFSGAGVLSGLQTRIVGWYNRALDSTAAVSTYRLGANGQPIANPANPGTFLFNPSLSTNLGKRFATGLEFYATKEVAKGLSGTFAATYQNEFTSELPLSGESVAPGVPLASLLLGNTYRQGFLSPLQTTLALTYTSPSGWVVNPRLRWFNGYPINAGLIGAAFVNGTPYNIPNTNVAPTVNPNGTSLFVDPENPGTLFAPNVAATRGTPESASTGGVLSHPFSQLDLRIEHRSNNGSAIGVDIFNLTNERAFDHFGYVGPQLNFRYQPVATGISGPLTGITQNAYTYPTLGFANYSPAIRGQEPYTNIPQSEGINFLFYYSQRIGGSQ